ncbi:type IV pilus assembly protein PilM [soil metagenome]
MNNNTKFYYDKPVFGIDIGFNSIKVMQTKSGGKKHKVLGYGVTTFAKSAMEEGLIADPEVIASAIHELFEKNLVGTISSKRVAVAIPASKTFNRTIRFPKMDKKKELDEAVRYEAEQYIPVPFDDLYMDYSIVSQTDKETEVLATAVPKRIVDSCVTTMRLLGLEPIAMETTINASGRLFLQAEQSDEPTILIDFGSVSVDITIFDKTLVVTGTVAGGGDNFSNLIAKKLNVSHDEAHIIKTKYGLGVSKKQAEITEALQPILDQLIKEIKRMIRYYEERKNVEDKIGQVVTLGGGANMPGLSEHMTNLLRLPVRMCDPWQHLDFGRLQPPNNVEKSMYVTVAGLALMNPQEIFS